MLNWTVLHTCHVLEHCSEINMCSWIAEWVTQKKAVWQRKVKRIKLNLTMNLSFSWTGLSFWMYMFNWSSDIFEASNIPIQIWNLKTRQIITRQILQMQNSFALCNRRPPHRIQQPRTHPEASDSSGFYIELFRKMSGMWQRNKISWM